MEHQIVLNRVKCLACGDIVTSHHHYDFVTCRCSWTSVDGGRSYLRRLGDDYKEMSVFSSAEFSIIREALHRGSCGPLGDQEVDWVPLSKISDKYLINLIDFVDKIGQNYTYDALMYKKEREYRILNKISVEGD
jgi:hypothetical protein